MFFYIYKLYLIPAEGYKNATVDLFKIKKMAKCGKKKVLQDGLDAPNIFDLLLKEIYSIDKTKSLTKDQIEKYKITKKNFLKNLMIQIKNRKHVCEPKKYSKNILLRFMELIVIFMISTHKKYKFMKMGENIYYLELMFILLNIS